MYATKADEKISVAYVMAPDAIKVELVENRKLPMPIAFHHVHLIAPRASLTAMRDWYVKMLGARAGKTTPFFESLDLPGLEGALAFSPADKVVGTTGRVVGHFGFEVKELQTFGRKLERSC